MYCNRSAFENVQVCSRKLELVQIQIVQKDKSNYNIYVVLDSVCIPENTCTVLIIQFMYL